MNREVIESGPFSKIDCRDSGAIHEVVKKHSINRIYHLVTAENNPQLAWDININTLCSMLEIARTENCSIFTPSSMGAFGPSSPKDYTPQDMIQRPTSIGNLEFCDIVK